jgi:hypothetical protein
MLKVLKKDPVNKHGERIVAKGPLTMLKDFEFNRHRALESSFKSTFSCSIDRPNGLAAVDIPAYSKATAIERPQGSTHYRLLMAAVDCDFSAGTSFVETSLSGLIPLDDTPADPLTLDCHVPVAGNHPIFLVLGIEYFVELNGVTERLKTESFNALQIVEVGIV